MQMLRAGVVVCSHQQRAAIAVPQQRRDGWDGDAGLDPPGRCQVTHIMVVRSDPELQTRAGVLERLSTLVAINNPVGNCCRGVVGFELGEQGKEPVVERENPILNVLVVLPFLGPSDG